VSPAFCASVWMAVSANKNKKQIFFIMVTV
jgi:hypothetical protein